MKIIGQHDDNTLAQIANVNEHAVRTALMADGHLGYWMPIGGVAAFDEQVSVTGVGYDIACGNCAIQTDLRTDFGLAQHREGLGWMADEIAAALSFGIGRKNKADDAPVDHPLFSSGAWDIIPPAYRDALRDKAREQLGTVGSGNHYVDVFAGSDERIWVGVHFGSRGFGHTVASNYMAIAAGKRWGDKVQEREVGGALLGLDTQAGKDYWDLMTLAGEYAYAGREWVARKVVQILGAQETDMVHNHHNFAWRENLLGQPLVVVRKGATPAYPAQRGFVGGSMGDDAVILKGAGSLGLWEEWAAIGNSLVDLQHDMLFSTVHGAGRVMSRSAAAGKVKRRTVWACGQRDCKGELPIQTDGENGANPRCPECGSKTHRRQTRTLVSEGLVKRDDMNAWLDSKGVILRGGGLDEAPQAYRRLPDVLAAQGPTVEVETTLRPLIVVMAGADEYDPYKD